MKELSEYRTKLMERLAEASKEFRLACLEVKDPYAPLDGGWNVHQTAVHIRDADKLVYGLRARRTAREDNPKFPNFDGDACMAENYDASEPLADVLNDFVESTEALVAFLQTLPAEDWSRLSRHVTLGDGLTLQTWVERNLAHIEEHLKTVKKQIEK
jgi:hypothetical protein